MKCVNCGAHIYEDKILGITHTSNASRYCYPEAAKNFPAAANLVAKRTVKENVHASTDERVLDSDLPHLRENPSLW